MGRPRIGLALSGGAAHGFAHIPVLEALDEAGVRPAVIAGTSMGALIGAAYAAGMSGAEIRGHVVDIFRNRADLLARLWQMRPRRLGEINLGFAPYDLEKALAAFLPARLPAGLGELQIPLRVVVTDYYAGRQVVLSDGPLLPALAASAAVPMLFRPIRIGGRVMVDGGVTNPVPFDLLDDTDVTIAVDALAPPSGDPERMPGGIECLFGATALVMATIVAAKLGAGRQPDIFVRPPPPAGINVFDFTRAARIIEASEPVKDTVKKQLAVLLGRGGGRELAGEAAGALAPLDGQP
jgi:NTE family protein